MRPRRSSSSAILAHEVGFSVTPNTGPLLENLVFLALRRRTAHIFYVRTDRGHEVDFLMPGERRLIQVAQSIDQPATREREVRALAEAMGQLGLDHALLLTLDGSDPIRVDGVTIEVRPIAEWLLAG